VGTLVLASGRISFYSRTFGKAADIVRKHYISEEQAKTSQLFFPYFAALQTKKVFGYRNTPAA